MTPSTLHIVFSDTAAGSLSRALREAGQENRVAGYFDNLALAGRTEGTVRYSERERDCTRARYGMEGLSLMKVMSPWATVGFALLASDIR